MKPGREPSTGDSDAGTDTPATILRRASLEEVEDEIIAEFAGLDDLTSKYAHLVRLGRGLRVPNGLRTDGNAVAGCQSRVWIRTELRDGRLRVGADSDAMIVRGLIALLLRIFNERTPGEVASARLRAFAETGLLRHLSPARSEGLAAMVRRIQELAEAYDS